MKRPSRLPRSPRGSPILDRSPDMKATGGPWISLVQGYFIFRNSSLPTCLPPTFQFSTRVEACWTPDRPDHPYLSGNRAANHVHSRTSMAKIPQSLMCSNVAHFEPQGDDASRTRCSIMMYLSPMAPCLAFETCWIRDQNAARNFALRSGFSKVSHDPSRRL